MTGAARRLAGSFPLHHLSQPPDEHTKARVHEIPMIIYTYDGSKRVWEDMSKPQERSSPQSTRQKQDSSSKNERRSKHQHVQEQEQDVSRLKNAANET